MKTIAHSALNLSWRADDRMSRICMFRVLFGLGLLSFRHPKSMQVLCAHFCLGLSLLAFDVFRLGDSTVFSDNACSHLSGDRLAASNGRSV